MNKLRSLMLEYPLLSIIVILPFSVVLVFAILDLIINIIQHEKITDIKEFLTNEEIN